jgi:malate dehydrogenase (oxaloacetate-decarboxylating)(NADP+)
MTNQLSDALKYHANPIAGKYEIVPTKPMNTQSDLSLAYSPGVAEPCLEIEKDASLAYQYTNKGNLVAVISNGTAVLGLGNIGALAGKPVMEGKAILFKKFSNIDTLDIEINTENVDEFVRTVELISPTFGAINLEDIKAPQCFEIEKQLKEKLNIPVFHDDQHGTAVVVLAGIVNALEVANKKIEDAKIVINGAGSAAIAILELLKKAGAKNIALCDSKGVIYKGRTENMNKYKEKHVYETEARTLKDIMIDSDVFIGVSKGDVLDEEMIKSMNKNPIIFALANPNPEAKPEFVASIRNDAIMATGRSDYPNQINNVLCFPYIFKGALDAKAKEINTEMKIAAAKAIAAIAKKEVSANILEAYDLKSLSFGRDYIIPTPFDDRLLNEVSNAVKEAAIKSGACK